MFKQLEQDKHLITRHWMLSNNLGQVDTIFIAFFGSFKQMRHS